MQYIKKFFKTRINLGYISSFSLLLFGSLALGFAIFIIQPGIGISTTFNYFINSKFLILFLNALPCFLAMLILFFATNNIVLSGSLVYFAVIILSLVNRNKIILREDPLRPWDLLLGGEVAAVFKGYKWDTYGLIVIFCIFMVVVTVIAIILFRARKMHFALRVAGVILTVIAVYFSNKYFFKSYQINKSMQVYGNVYNQVNIYDSKGFLYNFIYDYNTNRINKPADYDTAKIKELEEKYTGTSESAAAMPHVVMVLGEGFTELPNSENINFDGFENPIKFYNELKKQSVNGYIVSPGFGGGTADTEFDILTGINTRDFRGVPYANLLITRPMDSIASVFAGLGYNSLLIHPGYGWFYNRNNVMTYLGFDRFLDMSYFDAERTKGYYISEEATMERVISEFDDYLKSGNNAPFLELCITIQNHGPYADKYMSPTNFNSSVPISENDTNAISNYFEGLSDSDRELENLVAYLQSTEEPVVLVYFGDHFPLLSSEACDALLPPTESIPEELNTLRRYRVPYIIWQNDAAKKLSPIVSKEPDGGTISSIYLGAYLLELLGYEGQNPYFDYLNELRKTYPVILENRYLDKEYNVFPKDDTMQDDIGRLYMWEYYRLFEGK